MHPRIAAYDENGKLHDTATAIGSSAAGAVSAAAKILDLGAAARTKGTFRVEFSTTEIASNDELYTIILQGSSSATFASGIVNLCAVVQGATEVNGGAGDAASGDMYELPFHNVVNGTAYRYLRAYCLVAGTVASGVIYNAWVSMG